MTEKVRDLSWRVSSSLALSCSRYWHRETAAIVFARFFLLEVATNGADGRAGTIWRRGQNPGVLRFCHELYRIDPDRRAAAGVRDRIERAAGRSVHDSIDFSPLGELHDGLLRLRLQTPRDSRFHPGRPQRADADPCGGPGLGRGRK